MSQNITSFFHKILPLGSYSIYFNVTQSEFSKSITLKTDSYFLFQSSFDITFHEKIGYRNSNCSLMQIEHHFNIESLLFQRIVGDILRGFFREQLQRALINLKLILSNLKEEGLFMF